MHLLEGFVNEILSPELSSNDNEKAQYRNIQHVFAVLYLTTIFAVKFSFLFFFRTLIRRLRAITLYWRVVSVITALAWVFGISMPFIPGHNCDGNSKLSQICRHGYPSIISDTVTNLLSSYSLINPLPSLITSPKLTLSFHSRGHSHILNTSDSNWFSSKNRPGALPLPFNHYDQWFRHLYVHCSISIKVLRWVLAIHRSVCRGHFSVSNRVSFTIHHARWLPR